MTARVFNFDHAIVREPGRSVVAGIRGDRGSEPNYEGVLREHTAYLAALRAAGLAVDVLPVLEAFPDSVFVEDPALVFPEGAILLRPGAPSRLGEREAMRDALHHHFGQVLELQDHEHADGGDVLVTPKAVFIGLSQRTNRAGAEALRVNLAALGRDSRIVETPAGVLHFKTAVSLLNENVVFATAPMAVSGIFADFEIFLVPEGEEGAANSLRVNDVVLVGERYLRSIDLLAKKGFAIQPLPIDEIAKLDAGLSCMSLRWRVGV